MASEPVRDARKGTFSWRITARTIEETKRIRSSLERAVSSDGYAVFTLPVLNQRQPYQGWWEITGVTYDLL